MTGDLQKSRAGQDVPPETVAKYTAAKGFLIAEWLGALLMVGSILELYLVGLRPGGDGRLAWSVGIGMLLGGTWVFWTNRRYYLRLEFPWRHRWEVTAMLVASSAIIFWAMIVVAAGLVWRGFTPF